MSEAYVYGLHAVAALLKNSLRKTQRVYMSEGRSDKRLQDVLDQAQALGVPIERLSAAIMQQCFGDFAHQGVVASATPLPEYNEHHLRDLLARTKKPVFLLILDGITDPHNLGACLRSADAAGVDFVIIPKDKSACITPTVSKVACGAAEAVPLVRVTNLVRAMETVKKEGIWIYGAAGEAPASLYKLDGCMPLALVLGAEGEGLRRLTREHCDGLFSLPMTGSVTSLNVSVATGICLYEVLRQRQATGTIT